METLEWLNQASDTDDAASWYANTRLDPLIADNVRPHGMKGKIVRALGPFGRSTLRSYVLSVSLLTSDRPSRLNASNRQTKYAPDRPISTVTLRTLESYQCCDSFFLLLWHQRMYVYLAATMPTETV